MSPLICLTANASTNTNAPDLVPELAASLIDAVDNFLRLLPFQSLPHLVNHFYAEFN